jgi:ATPase family associated with various cellular activities (AAA)
VSAEAVLRAEVASWFSASERHLREQFARVRALLDPQREGPPPDAPPAEGALDTVVDAFGLTPFERDVLLLLAGEEMEAGIAEHCRAAGGVTFGLALACLPDPHWSAVTPDAPLRRWRLVELGPGTVAGAPLRIDERVLHQLAGVNVLDPRLRPALRLGPPRPNPVAAHRAAERRLAAECADAPPNEWPVIRLCGDDAEAQETVAANVAAAAGLALHVIAAADVPDESAERWAFATLWLREAALLDSALLIQAGSETGPARSAVTELAAMVGAPVFVAGAGRVPVDGPVRDAAIDTPATAERERLWRLALGETADAVADLIPVAAGQYELGAAQIARVAYAVRDAAAAGEDPAAALAAGCRSAAGRDMEPLARRIATAAGWDALVVPPATEAALRTLAAQVRHRATVYDAWGLGGAGRPGLGITALFAGGSGTGKTLAAEVLAHELGLDLYRIDLAAVVSKYIGETEKHLSAVFDGAEGTGAVLLFDEADALFGRRSEVSDSHDRYANIEVSYLLQRMDSYRGLAILTTNQKALLDRAFQRRLRFIVDFPFPDARRRELIWRGVFPPATPKRALDYAKLARLNVSGGAIRNIAVNGAFLAAASGRRVTMKHLAEAARAELAKSDHAAGDGLLGDWR